MGVAGFVNGDSYDGAFLDGKREGKGVYSFKANGDSYAGGYADNSRSGLGKYTFSSATGEDRMLHWVV